MEHLAFLREMFLVEVDWKPSVVQGGSLFGSQGRAALSSTDRAKFYVIQPAGSNDWSQFEDEARRLSVSADGSNGQYILKGSRGSISELIKRFGIIPDDVSNGWLRDMEYDWER
jgi:hypothetical protein